MNTRSNVPCCKLKEVSFKYKDGVYTKDIIKTVLEMTGVKKYSKVAELDDSDEDVKKSVEIVADIINGDGRPFEDMLSLAAATKDLVNKDIYAKAIGIVTLRRKDVGQTKTTQEESDEDLLNEIFVDYEEQPFDTQMYVEEGSNILDSKRILKEKEMTLAEKERILKEKEQLLNERERLLKEREILLDEILKQQKNETL